MSETSNESAQQMADAVREAIGHRREWSMPVVIVHFKDGPAPEGGSGAYSVAPQAELSNKTWPGAGREYEIAAELDRDDLDDLADYDGEDLVQYVADVLIW